MADQKQAAEEHQHGRIEVQSRCADCGQELGRHTFNRADIQDQQATELPDRDSMSLVNANLAIPVNLGLAANVLSDGSIAGAAANQTTPIGQGAGGLLPGSGSNGSGLLGGLA
jgi:hypothetical protein